MPRTKSLHASVWAAMPLPMTVGTSISEYSAWPGGAHFQSPAQNLRAATFSGRSTVGRPWASKMSPPKFLMNAFQTTQKVVPPLIPSSTIP